MISLSLLACALQMPVFCVFCLAEIEAKEACDWLRAAGFPQYAQLYEGNSNTLAQTQTAGSTSNSHAASRSCCLVLFIIFSIILLSSPPSGRCFLFPGSSSHPEGWVMGKALLSLLGLVQSSSLHSSTFSLPLHVCFLLHSRRLAATALLPLVLSVSPAFHLSL